MTMHPHHLQKRAPQSARKHRRIAELVHAAAIAALIGVAACGDPNEEATSSGEAFCQVYDCASADRLAPPGDDYDRTAIQQETFYALDPAHDGHSTKQINGWAVSDWNYLASDLSAYSRVKGWYGSNSSTSSLFFSNPTAYGIDQGYGRGGQCRYFADLILNRAGVRTRAMPTYSTTINDYNRGDGRRIFTEPYYNTHVGDVLSTKWANGHTAIAAKILAGDATKHNVSCVDVIDSNFVRYETIGRHAICAKSGPVVSGDVNDLRNYIEMNALLMKWNGY